MHFVLFFPFFLEQKIAILVATSGDTGSAAVDGFARHTDIPVAVLYPTHGVSRRQQQQLCVLAGQVFPGNLAIGVDADFDFCQASVKEMFNNESWCNDVKLASDFTFNSANSINWMRLLPQVSVLVLSNKFCRFLLPVGSFF